jgi:membrane-bound lytic murein transglycosylase MltF
MSRLTTLRRTCLRRLTLPAAPLTLAVAFLAFGCSEARVGDESTADMESAAPDGLTAEDPAATVAEEEDPWLRLQRVAKWTGDLDGMAERGFVRLLTVHSPTLYFVDGARERGMIAEYAPVLEKFLNQRLKPEGKRIQVIIIPVRRDQLLPFLVEGLGDLASANLTITAERSKLVDFTTPSFKDVHELVVTGPAGPELRGREDLSGQAIWVRASSSYYESLLRLNERFRAMGRPEILIRKADENLEDSDILEMVNASLLPATVMDSHKLDMLWSQVFTEITVHREMPIAEKGSIATAIRKDTPHLKEAMNEFLTAHKVGSEFANVLLNRYMKSNRWIKNANATSERRKYDAVVELFDQYGDRYDFDHLMLIAQGYQESTLDQSTRSRAGAVGVMQVLPTTAAGSPVFIPNIEDTESNIHAGVKYMRYIVDEYFDDPAIDPVNRMLFAFASYNAGPNRIARLRKLAPEYGLDPNEWFREVELIVQRKVGMEPVNYVGNIYKYYLAYKRIQDLHAANAAAEEQLRQQPAGSEEASAAEDG